MGKNITIYVPDEVAEEMAKYPEVNWSQVCREAIINYLKRRRG